MPIPRCLRWTTGGQLRVMPREKTLVALWLCYRPGDRGVRCAAVEAVGEGLPGDLPHLVLGEGQVGRLPAGQVDMDVAGTDGSGTADRECRGPADTGTVAGEGADLLPLVVCARAGLRHELRQKCGGGHFCR